MKGSRVAVTVAGSRRRGTVADVTYTVKAGAPVLTVDLDEPLPDGRERYLAAPESVEQL